MAKKKVEKYTTEDITMLCIQFCESKGGIINQEMGLSTIESLRGDKDGAIEKLQSLVRRHGDASDKKKLASIKNRL